MEAITSRWTRMIKLVLPVMAAGLSSIPVMAAERYSPDDLLSMNIEDLVNVKVTTLSKREETYMSTAGAVFVITNDDIRRSGVRSIPDALRLAPGLQVSQTNSNQFQIGIRGQTDFWTDLLLVMVDGRPVYNTTFSGVWWVAQNYPLEEIERIEVVRGPGGAIWGSNAVNGVINIITKNAGATQGLRVTAGTGTEETGFGNIRYGASIGKLDYRLYAMRETRDGGLSLNGITDAYDFRRMKQQGFRLDWQADATTNISLHGDAYQIHSGQLGYWMPNPTPLNFINLSNSDNGYSGKNLVLRMEKELTSNIAFKGQLFYDQYKVHTRIIREKKESFDGDFQLDFSDVLNQNISIGTNLRGIRSHFDSTPQFQMPSRSTSLASFFVNDELSLFDGKFRIIGGVKMEKNSYTKWESQPSIRAIASDDNWAIWASASKSVRTPNDLENGLVWNRKASGCWTSPVTRVACLVRQIGDGRAQTEKVKTYEIGARVRPTSKSLIEVTAFKTIYKGVLDTWQDRNLANPLIPQAIVPEYLTNVLNGKGDGIEANFRIEASEGLTFKGSYTYLHQNYVDYPVADGETIWTVRSNREQDPKSRFHAGVSWNPIKEIEFDANLYFNGPFRDNNVTGHHRLDVRVAYKPVEELEISFVGQDLMNLKHRENEDNSMQYSSLVQQRWYAQATYSYD
ncbi:outer membrane receptor for ferrienterochelin and colicins [Mariprofundus micogutta]|uniref:Outer membrane receptor for ferrienterochelin and colicins n=1 Tax=Mariprofundus micogutta TaxID=1921010 RepID=A0A1L8CQ71_9PROT|nr:TonB-dependent receptor plug domain-containing protein [Mariprofundus micogutta]GAV21076.1 outer membrane receptor for ferrienterochelin and colicins [Mariprofundus micogutta]